MNSNTGCGDKCKCDCCKAKKKAAAAAKRRRKEGPARKRPQKNNQPIIINTPSTKQQAYPTLNVSNHPSTLPRSVATQTDVIARPNTRTIETQTDVIRPLPEIPRLRETMTGPPRPAKYTRQPTTGFTREPTVAIVEPPSRYARQLEQITDAMANERHAERRAAGLGSQLRRVRIQRPQRSPPAVPNDLLEPLPDIEDLHSSITSPPTRGPGRPSRPPGSEAEAIARLNRREIARVNRELEREARAAELEAPPPDSV